MGVRSVQQTIINEQIGLNKGATQEYSTTLTDPGQVDFSDGDILTVTLTQTQGNQTVTLRYDAAAGGDADSRLTHPDEQASAVLVSDVASIVESLAAALGFNRAESTSLTETIQSAVGKGVSATASILESVAIVTGQLFFSTDAANIVESIQSTLGKSFSYAASMAESTQGDSSKGVSEIASIEESVGFNLVPPRIAPTPTSTPAPIPSVTPVPPPGAVQSLVSPQQSVEIVSPKGDAIVSIPPGAVKEQVFVAVRSLTTAEVPPIPSGLRSSNIILEVSFLDVDGNPQSGLRLETPVTIKISLPAEDLAAAEGATAGIVIQRYDTTANEWVPLLTNVDLVNMVASAKVKRFSSFALTIKQPLVTPTPEATVTPTPAPSPTAVPPLTGDRTLGPGLLMALALAGLLMVVVGGYYLRRAG